MTSTSNDSHKMKSLVDISKMVTESKDFLSIKDKIIEKMLEVVHPTKACVNLFYKNDYKYAYLVCSETLDVIPHAFPINTQKGIKISFDKYPKYIHEVVNDKKIVYIQNVFEDERAMSERELAKEEGYIGRIAFPFIMDNSVVGFMTCFLTETDYITEQDIDYISSVVSLISLSIEITNRNNNTQMLVRKLRGAIVSINDATKKLHLNKSIDEFLQHLSKQACYITNSKGAVIVVENPKDDKSIFNCYNSDGKNEINILPALEKILVRESIGEYNNNFRKYYGEIEVKSYIYYKLKDNNQIIGCIICSNSQNYTSDDLNILSILAKQVVVAMKLYQYNEEEVKHRVLANELNLLNKQQKLIMDKGILDLNKKELSYYHRPAKVIGGDFYHAVKIDDKNIAYIVADVMGHGMVSNYVVAMIKGAFKVLCNQYTNPGDILDKLNKTLYDEFDKMGVFTTCIIGIFNTYTNDLKISNAGHYNPMIVNKEGSIIKDLECDKSLPVGVFEDAKYITNTFNINEYPMMCMYTDGVLEIKNKNKEEYGIDRFKKFIQKNFGLSQSTIVENLKQEIKEFSGTRHYDDDLLIVMLKNK